MAQQLDKLWSWITVWCYLLVLIEAYIPDDLNIPIDTSIPRIRPLRRQIRHFEPGRTGEITVVFQTTEPDNLSIRWFRKAEKSLSNAEIPDHLSTEGDHRYHYRTFSLNDVRAVTLRVRDVEQREFPYHFVLVVTVGRRRRVEYQLDTLVEMPSWRPIVTELDEIRWVVLPSDPTSFSYNGFLGVTCVAVLDSEDAPPAITELQMYHVTFDKERPPPRRDTSEPGEVRQEVGNFTSVGIGKMYRGRGELIEETRSYMMMGTHTQLPGRYLRFEVTRRIRNATRKDEGAYACVVERDEDRLFASSWVREGRPARRPALEVIPCESSSSRKYKRRRDQDWDYRLRVSGDKETCIRCRAFAYPPPDMTLTKAGDRPVVSDWLHHVAVHQNVADGGFMELTYTLWQPRHADSGLYRCTAYYDDDKKETIKFKLEIR